MSDQEKLSARETASIRAGIEEIDENRLYLAHSSLAWAKLTLQGLWESRSLASRVRLFLFSIRIVLLRLLPTRPSGKVTRKQRAAERRSPTIGAGWYIGMSNEFMKSVQSIDRKLQGRILEALSIISSEPTTPRGDTIKPLSADLKGLWRYRIGDFRLVYRPDIESKHVVLVTFASRGSVYE